jgi:hypothetical protein
MAIRPSFAPPVLVVADSAFSCRVSTRSQLSQVRKALRQRPVLNAYTFYCNERAGLASEFRATRHHPLDGIWDVMWH